MSNNNKLISTDFERYRDNSERTIDLLKQENNSKDEKIV